MAQKKTILKLALPTPLRQLFDYLAPSDCDTSKLACGTRVLVSFQTRQMIGILVAIVDDTAVPKHKLKTAIKIVDDTSLFTPDILYLCQWAAEYYHASLGEVYAGALPVLLRKGRMPALTVQKDELITSTSNESSLALNVAQANAVEVVLKAKESFSVFLLEGVTGSGKTEVYLQMIAVLLQANKQVLMLVPEISLTPQTIQRFRARFSVPMVALHSHLGERERAQSWLLAQSGQAKLVIGTRSAIFTPLPYLAMIIVDEEHDSSFKQQDRFRYHARDLAIMRAKYLSIPIVLGSATPALESLVNVTRQKYQLLSLPNRAGGAALPQQNIIDVRQQKMAEGLSTVLLEKIREQLAQENQVMLFLNRRGFAPVLLCDDCGWMAACKRCDTRMVYHRTPARLQCHYCDAQQAIPKQCEQCQSSACQPIGLGTQRIEQVLKRNFPEIPVIRVDRDTTRRKNSLADLLSHIEKGNKAIILGTQMLAKGHHFPNVTLVGVIDADNGLFSADYRAVEQMGQLLVQVAGRAGRAEKSGTVLIQTRYPDHPLLQNLLQYGYKKFAALLCREREVALLPPFASLAILRAEAHNENAVFAFLNAIRQQVDPQHDITLLGPVPAALFKRKGYYRAQLWLKATQRKVLHSFLQTLSAQIDKIVIQHKVRWLIDVDPTEIF